MKKQDKTYSVIIISDSTSANKEFTISSKLIKKVFISTFLLLFILVFIIFDYLTISFDKVRMKELEQKIITLQNERKKSDLSTERDLNNKLIILDKIQKSINSVDLDISKKKDLIKELIQTDNKLKSMKKEINEIKPTLQKSKKEYSEYVKIFSDHYKKVYDEIYKKRIWKERIIVLFIGVIASIIAGYILLFFVSKIKKKKEVNMIMLGIYQAQDDKKYDCHFILDRQTAKAIDPLPRPGQAGSRGVAFEVRAKSEQEAKQKLAEAIGPGYWS